MRRNEALDFVTAELKAHGVRYETSTLGSGHIEIRWQVPDKEVRCYAVSNSPSDVRGRLNARAHVRRTLKADGVQLDRRAVQGPPKKPALLATALEIPRHVEPLPDQVAHLRAEVADLTELALDMAGTIGLIRDHILGARPAPTPEPEPVKPIVRRKKVLNYISTNWSSIDAIARDMELTAKQVYSKLYYLKDRIEMHEGRARLRPVKPHAVRR